MAYQINEKTVGFVFKSHRKLWDLFSNRIENWKKKNWANLKSVNKNRWKTKKLVDLGTIWCCEKVYLLVCV